MTPPITSHPFVPRSWDTVCFYAVRGSDGIKGICGQPESAHERSAAPAPESSEVALEPEGTPLGDWQAFRTKVVSEMFEAGPDECGIYRTTRLYAALDEYMRRVLGPASAGPAPEDSPDSVPPELKEFAARDYQRINRHAGPAPQLCPECGLGLHNSEVCSCACHRVQSKQTHS